MGPGDGDVRFGYDPGDYMIQYFVAPTEMTIKGVGFFTNDIVADAAAVEVKIVSIDWPLESITQFPLGTGGYYLGYFEGSNDHGISALPDDETTTGAWVDKGNAATSPFGADLWSDAGLGAPAIPVNGADVWVSMDLLGFEPELAKGAIFGVVVKNISPAGTDVLRAEALSGGQAPAGMKYYANGRLDTDPTSDGFDPGWWVRTTYAWNMAVAVEYTGDTPPVIGGVTSLLTTLSTEARTVEATITDANPSGGDAGVASAVIKYSVDGGDMMEVAMTGSGDVYTGDIPGQAAGSAVSYYVMATDVGGNTAESGANSYNVFKPSGAQSLLVLNGQGDSGYPQDYYFRQAPVAGWYDKWAYGPLSVELLENYKHVFEICTNGPADYNDDAIAAWLAADGTRNYLLSGEEWLGARNGYTDETFAAGSFQYDVLGLAASYNDITYDGTSGQELGSLVFAVEGSDLGGQLFTDFAALGTDSLYYDPLFEIGSASNWMDGFDVSTAAVDMNVETRGVAGAADVRVLAAAAHNTTAAGNKVVFMTMDPISINSTPDYVWWGDSTAAVHYKAAEWFGAFVVSVEDEQLNPTEFSLDQNYPNPFNPATTITFSLTQKSDVSLKVFNLLGQEVATVVNGVKTAGVHKVNFDASELTSGVYFYTIKSGEFVSTKKMILLK